MRAGATETEWRSQLKAVVGLGGTMSGKCVRTRDVGRVLPMLAAGNSQPSTSGPVTRHEAAALPWWLSSTDECTRCRWVMPGKSQQPLRAWQRVMAMASEGESGAECDAHRMTASGFMTESSCDEIGFGGIGSPLSVRRSAFSTPQLSYYCYRRLSTEQWAAGPPPTGGMVPWSCRPGHVDTASFGGLGAPSCCLIS